MTIPQWTLLGFSAWTLGLLMATVGVYRWFNILFAKAGLASFRSDQLEGAGWYQRGTRAHANCIENLPVFGAIVYVISTVGLRGRWSTRYASQFWWRASASPPCMCRESRPTRSSRSGFRSTACSW